MPEFTTFWKGLIIGFLIAAPVGPIGVLCIQRTLNKGRISGFVSGLGAATADGLYGAIAAFGITIISDFLVERGFLFRFIGGVFLFYLGIKIFFSKPVEKVEAENHKGLFFDYLSTVFFTLANPTTIISFLAVFAGLGLGSVSGNVFSAILMTAGVTIGSALWWLILSSVTSIFRKKFTIASLALVNKISGSVIIIFAVLAFLRVFSLFLFTS